MKQIAYILIDQGLTTHGDVTTQINTALTTANENFTALEESVTSSTTSVSELSGKVTAAEERITTLEAANVDATQRNSGKMTAAHVKALQAATDKSTKNATTIQDLRTSVNNKVDKVTGKQLSQENFTTAEKQKLAGIANGATKVTDAERQKWNAVAETYVTQEALAAANATIEAQKKEIDTLKSEQSVSISEFVSGVTVAPGSTSEKGSLVYDKIANKFLWKVMYNGVPTPTYFAQTDKNILVGKTPKMGVVYLCGNRVYVGVSDGLCELLRNEIS